MGRFNLEDQLVTFFFSLSNTYHITPTEYRYFRESSGHQVGEVSRGSWLILHVSLYRLLRGIRAGMDERYGSFRKSCLHLDMDYLGVLFYDLQFLCVKYTK